MNGSAPAVTPAGSKVPVSKIVRMFGWFRSPVAGISCSKRRSRSGSVATAGGRILIATSRPMRGSIDLPHPPGADRDDQFVRSQAGACGDRHVVRVSGL
jgi:hypothetical protein